MKIFKIVGFIVLGVLVVAWIGGTFFLKKEESDQPISESSEKKVELDERLGSKELVKYLMQSEPTAKEVIVNDAGVVYVAVLDDGNNRNGLASYYCEVIKEQSKIKLWKVRIMLEGSAGLPDGMKDNAYGVILGESVCN